MATSGALPANSFGKTMAVPASASSHVSELRSGIMDELLDTALL